MGTSVSTNVLVSVATTLQALPQTPCVGLPVADVRPPLPNSTEWGFEKAFSSCALQPFPNLFPNSRFSERPNDIPDNAQPGLCRFHCFTSIPTCRLRYHIHRLPDSRGRSVTAITLISLIGRFLIPTPLLHCFLNNTGNTRAMREAAKVVGDRSSLTTTGHPLASSTSLITVRVTSRRVIEFFVRASSGKSKIKAAGPFFPQDCKKRRPNTDRLCEYLDLLQRN